MIVISKTTMPTTRKMIGKEILVNMLPLFKKGSFKVNLGNALVLPWVKISTQQSSLNVFQHLYHIRSWRFGKSGIVLFAICMLLGSEVLALTNWFSACRKICSVSSVKQKTNYFLCLVITMYGNYTLQTDDEVHDYKSRKYPTTQITWNTQARSANIH